MSDEKWDMKICCMGAGYVGGTSMAVMAKQCPKVCRLLLWWYISILTMPFG